MKTTIDNFDDQTDWAGSAATVTVHAENQLPQYIANDLSKSLVFHFATGSSGEYMGKTLSSPIDVTDYDEIVVSFQSLHRASSTYRTSDDFPYILDLGAGKQYYIPSWKSFSQISIDITDISSIERIRFIANHNYDDYVVVSYMIAVKDEIPLDIFQAFKDGLEAVRTEKFPYGGPLVATLTAAAAATQVSFGGARSYLADNAVVLIRDGSNSEIHQLYKGDGATFKFTKLFDGKSMINSFTGASVYLYYPIVFGTYASEALFPGISIWGFVPTPVRKNMIKEEIIKGFHDNEFQYKRAGMNEAWRIIIDAEAFKAQNIADMTWIIRTYLSRNVVWLNGRDFDIEWTEVPVEEEPTDALNIVPKINYLIDIEIVEDVQSNITKAKIVTDTVTYYVKEQGEIP